MNRKISKLGIVMICAAAASVAQQTPPPGQPAPPPGQVFPPPESASTPRPAEGPRMVRIPRGEGQPAMSELMPRPGRWWGNPEMVQKLGLSADQVKRMDDIFQQSRLQLIRLEADLKVQEVTLEPLVSADQPDETKILAQIDKVVQARAELEKANARMLLGLRRVLTPEQWQKLKADAPRPRPAEPRPAPPPNGRK